MKRQKSLQPMAAMLLSVLLGLACRSIAPAATPTLEPTITPKPQATPTTAPKPTSTPIPVMPSPTTSMAEWSFNIEFHFGSLFVIPCINSTGQSYSGSDINAYFEKGHIELVTPNGDKLIFEKNPVPDPMLESMDISGVPSGTTQCLLGLRINHEELLKDLPSGKYSLIWKAGDLQSNEVVIDWNGTTITATEN